MAGLAAAAATFLALRPLASGFWGHDIQWHLVRIAQWHRGVMDGVLYPRFFHDIYWGHGGPVMIFCPPLPYVVSEVFSLIGAGPVRALSLSVALGFALGAAALFLLARRDLGTPGAWVAAAAYSLAPYHLVNAWVRAAYAELLAMAILPLLLLAARAAVERRDAMGATGLALATALMVLTHQVSAVFCLPLAALYALWRAKELPGRAWAGAFAWLAAGLAAGAALSAFYWVPALAEQGETHMSDVLALPRYAPVNHLLVPRQLFVTRWGFGGSYPGPNDEMSFQLGLPHVAALLGGGLLAWRGAKLVRDEVRFWLVTTAIAAFLTLTSAEWFWRLTPVLHSIQFPWRLLAVAALGSSICAGALARLADSRPAGVQIAAIAVMAALILAAYAPFAIAQAPRFKDDQYTPEALAGTGGAETFWRPKAAAVNLPPSPRVAVVEGAADVSVLEDRTQRFSARVDATTPAALRFSVFDFPGWRAEVDGAESATRADRTGAIVVNVPEGEHIVRLTFGSTPWRRGAAWVSLLALVLVAATLSIPLRRFRRFPRPSADFHGDPP